MAFSDTIKIKIVFHLGYPATSIVVGSSNFNSIISDRLSNLTPDIEGMANALILDIEGVRTKLISSQDIMKTSRVGDISINENENKMLRLELKRLSKELGELLDIKYRKSSSMIRVCY